MPNIKLKIHNKPLYTAAASVYPYSKALELHFLVQPKFQEDEAVFLAKKSGDFLLVPRELAPLGEDRRSRGSPIKVAMKMPPRSEEQAFIIENSTGLLLSGKSHTLQGAVGFGKSFCGVNLIANLGMTALVLVTKEDLLIQWKQNFLKYTDLKEDEIGVVQQNRCDYGPKIKVAIGMVHSISSCDYPSDFYDHWGLVVADEAHRMSCNYFVATMFKLNSFARLALTATPKRADGKAYVFMSHLGQILSKAKNHISPPKVIVVNSGWRIPKWKKRDPATGSYEEYAIPHKPGRMASVVKAMGSDDARNHLIADLCWKAYQKDRKIVIFFEQIAGHLKKLKPILVKIGIPAKEITEYIGGLTDKQRVDNAKGRVILGSYTYFSEGTDIPDLDTAILASPRSNVMQAIGRILRVVEGKKESVIFDIVDEHSEALVNMHHSRMRCYNELKANIVRF